MTSLKNTVQQHNLLKTMTSIITSKPSNNHFKEWPNTAGFNALKDTRQKVELQVSGQFPDYVAGSLYRTGPGGYKVPRIDPKKGDFECSHWFDGFVTTHLFELTPSKDNTGMRVTYSSRSQVDELVERARKTGKLEGISFGQKRDPCESFFKKLKTVFEQSSVPKPQMSNVGVTVREATPNESSDARTMVLGTDAHFTKTFDMDTLEPKGVTIQSQIHPALKGPISAAHAERDPITGDLFNYNLDFPSNTYRVFRVSAATGQVDILATITGLKGAYLHSMLLTENFVILCVWPANFLNNGINILWKRNILEAISFDPEAKATWLVIDRRGTRGLVQKFTSPAFFCFHTTNAWEESRDDSSSSVDIHCELVEFPNSDILQKFYYQNLVSDQSGVQPFDKAFSATCQPSLTRYRLPNISLDSSSSSTSSTVLTAERYSEIPSPKSGELPIINPAFSTKPHRYVWSVLDRGLSSFFDGLGKTDAREGSCLVWGHPGHTPGEPIFVANPEGTEEDDGVLLTVVLDGAQGTSYLLCLDARTMQEVARADVRSAVGFGFHGVHLKGAL